MIEMEVWAGCGPSPEGRYKFIPRMGCDDSRGGCANRRKILFVRGCKLVEEG